MDCEDRLISTSCRITSCHIISSHENAEYNITSNHTIVPLAFACVRACVRTSGGYKARVHDVARHCGFLGDQSTGLLQ